MIEIWQLVLIGLYLWFFYDLTQSPPLRVSNQQLKDFVNKEITRMASREKQMRIRLGMEPLIT